MQHLTNDEGDKIASIPVSLLQERAEYSQQHSYISVAIFNSYFLLDATLGRVPSTRNVGREMMCNTSSSWRVVLSLVVAGR